MYQPMQVKRQGGLKYFIIIIYINFLFHCHFDSILMKLPQLQLHEYIKAHL